VEGLAGVMDKGLEELFDQETIGKIYAGNAKAFLIYNLFGERGSEYCTSFSRFL
jgi:hypothetical protein